jgi:hypothetical protein
MAPAYTLYVFETSLSVVIDNVVVQPRILLIQKCERSKLECSHSNRLHGFSKGGLMSFNIH